jgi:hypothetical protein
MENRRLRQAADDLVGAGQHQVGSAAEGACREGVVEVEVGSPSFVYHERNVAGVSDVRELFDAGNGTEVCG